MNKETFNKLSVDHKWTVVHEYTKLLKSATHNRMSLLPATAAIAVGLLVITTFKQDILSLSWDIKLMVSILLFLIPLPLYLYNEDQKSLANKSKVELEKLRGAEFTREEQGLRGRLTAWMPDIIIYVLSLFSIILIFHLWKVC